MSSRQKIMINNLPTQLTQFIGREQEAADIQQLLTEARLLTLTGPSGFVKARLAVEVAASLGEVYGDGVCWVELATLTDGALEPLAREGEAWRAMRHRW